MELKNATLWTCFWLVLSVLFSIFVYIFSGADNAITYLSGYALEKMLSIDNLFMFYVLFSCFKTPERDQPKILSYGIIGACVLRGTLILSGCYLIAKFSWLLYGFGAFLVYTGFKIAFTKEDESEGEGPMLNFMKRNFPNVSLFLLTLIAVEITDFIFALDSIPAIFGVTTNWFLICTSNLFAILGLRSMYFVILGMIDKFCYLPIAVSLILSFIGGKILISHWLTISPLLSFSIIGCTLATASGFSLLKEKYK